MAWHQMPITRNTHCSSHFFCLFPCGYHSIFLSCYPSLYIYLLSFFIPAFFFHLFSLFLFVLLPLFSSLFIAPPSSLLSFSQPRNLDNNPVHLYLRLVQLGLILVHIYLKLSQLNKYIV